MLFAEAFEVAFNIAESSTEDLKLAQLVIEYTPQGEEQSYFAIVCRLAIHAISLELEERRLRLRQQLSAARRLHRRQQENTKDFTKQKSDSPAP